MLRCSCTEIHAVFGIGRLRVSKTIPNWVGFALLRQAPGLERFSIEYQSNHWPSTEDNPVNQANSPQIRVADTARGRTCVSESRMVLVIFSLAVKVA